MSRTIDSFRIAENIKEIRLINNLTQIEMAEKLGYSERTIRRLESNGTYDIGVINLIAKQNNINVQSVLKENAGSNHIVGNIRGYK